MKHNLIDLDKVKTFLRTYCPFLFYDTTLPISLSPHVAALPEDINCEHAPDLGYALHDNGNNKLYTTVSLRKADQVRTNATLTNKSSDINVKVSIDPHNDAKT